MDVLRNMVEAVKPGGVVLDLQVIPPNPIVESDGLLLCEVDGEPLLRKADAAAAAIEALVTQGRLVEEAVDDHDSLEHFDNGAALVAYFAGRTRRLPEDELPRLRAWERPCVIRERCRLRRLRVVETRA